jgi:hypothetical protein
VVHGFIFCDKSLIDKIPKEDLPLYINFPFQDWVKEYYIEKLKSI